MKYSVNVGGLDGVLRLVIGGGLCYLGFFNTGIINDAITSWLLGGFGLVIFLTGVFRYCPFYYLIGFSSRQQ